MTGKNYIGFQQLAAGSMTFRTYDPVQDRPNDTLFTEATSDEIEQATFLAEKAFRSYRTTEGSKRAAFLRAIADEILALDEILIQTYMKESGLPQGRAIGERGRTVGQLRMFAELIGDDAWRKPTIDRADPSRTPVPKPDLRKLLIPLGPVVVFGASNFPLAYSTAGGDTASALAAGCPVIVKSHPMHAGTGELVASAVIKAAQAAGMPEGVFSNLNSSGIEVGKLLVMDPKVKAVGFTGSIGGGRALFDLAAQRDEPIPVFAEMGSVNPVIISRGAIKNRSGEIATTYSKSITLGTGQFCTNPGLLLTIDCEGLDEFIQDLGRKTVSVDAHSMLHPNIHSAFQQKGSEVLSQEGSVLVAEYDKPTQNNYAGARIATVSGEHFLRNTKLHQEVFGPFSLVVRCKDEAELVQVIQSLEGQLTGTILAEKEEYTNLAAVIDALQDRVGRIIFNGVPTGVEVCDAMTHGGPYPASTDSRFTAVGNHSILRWVRPFSYQDFPKELLPEVLKEAK
ncbi:MAG: aldehyde dehydrogenase (NADP(+)) [Bacteroidia bacterium]|nr:aldehyde dehydrogenase (NADP(+)) [Bacteroidia bacterium]NNM22873.1 aldehyde dehydrogenase (NADP(+)) [Flavobacteriaceae bacterium]